MKKKRGEKRKRCSDYKAQRQRYWLPIILASLVPAGIVTAAVYRIPARFVVPPIVIVLWIAASIQLWQRANAHARGDEWWQDDNC